jgi:hypothetical protein
LRSSCRPAPGRSTPPCHRHKAAIPSRGASRPG